MRCIVRQVKLVPALKALGLGRSNPKQGRDAWLSVAVSPGWCAKGARNVVEFCFPIERVELHEPQSTGRRFGRECPHRTEEVVWSVFHKSYSKTSGFALYMFFFWGGVGESTFYFPSEGPPFGFHVEYLGHPKGVHFWVPWARQQSFSHCCTKKMDVPAPCF